MPNTSNNFITSVRLYKAKWIYNLSKLSKATYSFDDTHNFNSGVVSCQFLSYCFYFITTMTRESWLPYMYDIVYSVLVLVLVSTLNCVLLSFQLTSNWHDGRSPLLSDTHPREHFKGRTDPRIVILELLKLRSVCLHNRLYVCVWMYMCA